MKLGISAFAWTGNFRIQHLDLIPAVKEMGFDALEIPMFEPESLPLASIRAALRANDLDCTVCAILPEGVNPISPDPDLRREAVSHLRKCVDATAQIGAKLIGGPLYAPIGYLPKHRSTGEEWFWCVEAFQALGGQLAETGLRLAIEPVNRSETFLIRTVKDAIQLCERIGDPRIGVTLDTFHANIEEPSIPGAVRALGKRLSHVHASESDRGPLGSGHVPFDQVVTLLKEMGYEGYIIVEGFGYLPEEKDSPGYLWADKALSPQRLAIESYRHLQRLGAV